MSTCSLQGSLREIRSVRHAFRSKNKLPTGHQHVQVGKYLGVRVD